MGEQQPKKGLAGLKFSKSAVFLLQVISVFLKNFDKVSNCSLNNPEVSLKSIISLQLSTGAACRYFLTIQDLSSPCWRLQEEAETLLLALSLMQRFSSKGKLLYLAGIIDWRVGVLLLWLWNIEQVGRGAKAMLGLPSVQNAPWRVTQPICKSVN